MMLVSEFTSWRRAAGVCTLAAAILAACGVSHASDGIRYSRRGQAFLLSKSQTELAIEFSDAQEVNGAQKRLSRAGGGRMRLLPGTTQASPWRILQVADTGMTRRRSISADPAIVSVHPVWRQTGADVPLLATGEIVVQLKPGMSAVERDALLAAYDVRPLVELAGLRGMYVVESMGDADGDDVSVAGTMHGDPRIEWAHSNLICPVQKRQIVPDDQYFNFQWHLSNTGQSDPFGQHGTPGADIGVLKAWETTLGTDVLVGMFDDSCDYRHEDLRDGYIGTGFDASLDSSDDGYRDPRPKSFGDRHGTAVMGLAVARPNSTGVRGVAPLARFTATAGLGRAFRESQTALVYSFALQQGVDVHINSWGFADQLPHPAVETAIQTAFEAGRDPDGTGGKPARGMIIVFATGNEDQRVVAATDLSMLPMVIGVGASNADDLRASYSNFGPDIVLLAPSGDDFLPAMVTTDNTDEFDYPESGYNVGGFDDFGLPNLDVAGKYTDDFGGTSASCPVAAGVAALMLSVNRELTATQVRLVLEHTAKAIGPEGTYHPVTQFSEKYGYGRIDAAAAVVAAEQAIRNNRQTWPERPKNVTVDTRSNTIRWKKNVENAEYLMVESSDPSFGTTFGFRPADEVCYVNDGNDPNGTGQFACKDVADGLLGEVPEGLTIIHWQDDESREFASGGGAKSFALFARNRAGRYSWGVYIKSDGTLLRSGPTGTNDPGE